MPSVTDFSATGLAGEEVALSSFEGKVLLIVNTASKCGFTPQYRGLEDLQQAYAPRGFSVLGFPCNQFGDPLYKFLKSARPGVLGLVGWDDIKWNFTKFLVGRDGQAAARFAPTATPNSLKGKIEKLLSVSP